MEMRSRYLTGVVIQLSNTLQNGPTARQCHFKSLRVGARLRNMSMPGGTDTTPCGLVGLLNRLPFPYEKA
jgi:hypothetical protein